MSFLASVFLEDRAWVPEGWGKWDWLPDNNPGQPQSLRLRSELTLISASLWSIHCFESTWLGSEKGQTLCRELKPPLLAAPLEEGRCLGSLVVVSAQLWGDLHLWAISS